MSRLRKTARDLSEMDKSTIMKIFREFSEYSDDAVRIYQQQQQPSYTTPYIPTSHVVDPMLGYNINNNNKDQEKVAKILVPKKKLKTDVEYFRSIPIGERSKSTLRDRMKTAPKKENIITPLETDDEFKARIRKHNPGSTEPFVVENETKVPERSRLRDIFNNNRKQQPTPLRG